ncbi:MAG: DUF4256 domain-containing protein [Aestuariibaculum sp.]
MKNLSAEKEQKLLEILKIRFDKNMNRHQNMNWGAIETKLKAYPKKIWSLSQMEETGGEPDVVDFDKNTNEYLFFDCSIETPKGRRSYCYDQAALDARKNHKPKDNAINVAKNMEVELLSEAEYFFLQKLGTFDTKTSSWIKTPNDIRSLGGAIFGDYRFGRVFIYHNGADSYYAARGFRSCLRV